MNQEINSTIQSIEPNIMIATDAMSEPKKKIVTMHKSEIIRR